MVLKNPEFKKNIKQGFSYSKLLVPAILISIIVIFCLETTPNKWQEDWPEGYSKGVLIFAWFCFIGFFYSIVMGTFEAVNSFQQEFKQNTWDFIRMSKISAKDLILGKILGANLPIWLCTIFLIIPALVFSIYLRLHTVNNSLIQDYRLTALIFSGSIFCWIVLSYMLSVSVFLFAKATTNIKSVAGVIIPILGINFSVGMSIMGAIDPYLSLNHTYEKFKPGDHNFLVTPELYMRKPPMIAWYGQDYYYLNFYSFQIAFFAICSIVLCFRILQSHLQFKQKPIFWFLFCILSTILINGIGPASNSYKNLGLITPQAHLNSGLFSLYILTLAILMIESINQKKHAISLKYLAEGNIYEFLSISPIWVRTFIVLFIFSITDLIIHPDIKSAILSFSIIGLLFRDFLAMSYISRLRKVRFPLFANFLYLIIFYALLPLLMSQSYSKNTTSRIGTNSILLPQTTLLESDFGLFLVALFILSFFWAMLLRSQRAAIQAESPNLNA